MDQELADTAAYALDKWFMCTQQMAALLYKKRRHGHQLQSMTSYPKSDCVNWCVFTWSTILPEFLPNPIWNNEALGFVWRGSPQPKQEEQQEEERTTTTTAIRWVTIQNQFLSKMYFWHKLLTHTEQTIVTMHFNEVNEPSKHRNFQHYMQYWPLEQAKVPISPD